MPQVVRARAGRVLRSPWTRVAGTLAGIALLLHSINLGKAFDSIRAAHPAWVTLALALSGIAMLASVGEWGVLLRGTGHRVGWRSLAKWYVEGLFVGQVLPAAVGGDAMRAVEVGKVTGPGHALASLAGSRMAGTLGMAIWGVAGAVILRGWMGVAGIVGASAFAATMILAWTMALYADSIVRRLGHHRTGVRRHIHRFLTPFTGAFRSYRARPQLVLKCMLIGAAGWGINLGALALFARAVGVDAGWSLFAVAIPVSLIATLSPVSFNGMGLREGVLIGLLGHIGVGAARAGALSVFVDLQMIPFALIGGVLWMRRRRARVPAAPALAPVPITA